MFYTFTKSHLKKTRRKRRLSGLVEIHHVIPREHAKHPTIIQNNYKMEKRYNLVFCPSEMGKNVLNLREERPVHSGGHREYNEFVKYQLDNCIDKDDFFVLWFFLLMACRGFYKVPWK